MEHVHPHHSDHQHGKPLIRFDHATFRYPHGPALEDITFEIADGEFIGVIGPNGSGKTTLLRAILGLMPPSAGSLQIFDCACERLQCYHRARIGYLPQKELVDASFPITVEETVLMGRAGVIGEGSAATFAQLRGVLERALSDRGAAIGLRDEPARVDAELRRAGIGPGHQSLYEWSDGPEAPAPDRRSA